MDKKYIHKFIWGAAKHNKEFYAKIEDKVKFLFSAGLQLKIKVPENGMFHLEDIVRKLLIIISYWLMLLKKVKRN